VLDPSDARHQVNAYSCGPAALYHALCCYGVVVPIRKLLALSEASNCACEGSPRDGRCEHQLQRVAGELGFQLEHWVSEAPADLYVTLRRFLSENVPVLACVEHGAHWVCVVHGTTRHVKLCDSGRDQEEVLQRWTWRRLAVALAYGLPARFDLYPLVVL